jgi:hypothetical protein
MIPPPVRAVMRQRVLAMVQDCGRLCNHGMSNDDVAFAWDLPA